MFQILDNEKDLKLLLNTKRIVVLYFSADWCGPCKMMHQPLEDLAKKYDDVLQVIKINVDEFMDTAEEYDVTSLPTFIFYNSGKLSEKFTGASVEKFNNYLNNFL